MDFVIQNPLSCYTNIKAVSALISVAAGADCPGPCLSVRNVLTLPYFARFTQCLPDQDVPGYNSGCACSFALDTLLILFRKRCSWDHDQNLFLFSRQCPQDLFRITICLHEMTLSCCGFSDKLTLILCFIVLFSFLQGFFQQYVAGKRSEILRFCAKFLQKIYRNAGFMF